MRVAMLNVGDQFKCVALPWVCGNSSSACGKYVSVQQHIARIQHGINKEPLGIEWGRTRDLIGIQWELNDNTIGIQMEPKLELLCNRMATRRGFTGDFIWPQHEFKCESIGIQHTYHGCSITCVGDPMGSQCEFNRESMGSMDPWNST